MDDIKLYEFILKLNTYLNRVNGLANKLIREEQKLGGMLIAANAVIPTELFNQIFSPMIEIFDRKEQILKDIQESDNVLEDGLKDIFEQYKGIMQ